MALPLPPGLTPNEVGFLCEMELVTVIPRQRLESLELLGGATPRLHPPFPARMPLWLALLLKRQRRAHISPPAWLSVGALTALLDFETDESLAGVLSPSPALPAPVGAAATRYLAPEAHEVSAPFLPDSATAHAPPDALPYHWIEIAHLLLSHASDDFPDPERVRRLVRDLREVRMSKLRRGYQALEAGAGLKVNGVGGMEVAEVRGFVCGVVDGLRRLNRSREETQREEEADGGGGGGRFGRSSGYADEDDDLQL